MKCVTNRVLTSILNVYTILHNSYISLLPIVAYRRLLSFSLVKAFSKQGILTTGGCFGGILHTTRVPKDLAQRPFLGSPVLGRTQ